MRKHKTQDTRHKTKPLFGQITIVGLGLIGGSIGLALKKKKLARQVVGVSRKQTALNQAKRARAIDRGTRSLEAGIRDADLVILATPPQTIVGLAQRIARLASGSLILTDVGSTKSEILKSLDAALPPQVHFVGGHPMAGSERSGIGAIQEGLFEGATCILTPTRKTNKSAFSKVRGLWRGIGSTVAACSPQVHDDLVAQISHIPHLAAVGLVHSVDEKALCFIGSGFRDTTRLAMASPAMWEKICTSNRLPITRGLDRLIRQLKGIRQDLNKKNSRGLRRQLDSAARKRRKL